MRVVSVFLSLISCTVFAITVPLEKNKRLTLPLSTEGVNMLEVSGDRIVKLVFQGATLQIEGDARDGRLFISPKMPKNSKVFATLFTEKGRIQPLSFEIKDEIAPMTLTLTAFKKISSKKKANIKKQTRPRKVNNESRILELLKDAIEGRISGQKTNVFCSGQSFENVVRFKRGYLTVTRIEGLRPFDMKTFDLKTCFKDVIAKTDDNKKIYIVSKAL